MSYFDRFAGPRAPPASASDAPLDAAIAPPLEPNIVEIEELVEHTAKVRADDAEPYAPIERKDPPPRDPVTTPERDERPSPAALDVHHEVVVEVDRHEPRVAPERASFPRSQRDRVEREVSARYGDRFERMAEPAKWLAPAREDSEAPWPSRPLEGDVAPAVPEHETPREIDRDPSFVDGGDEPHLRIGTVEIHLVPKAPPPPSAPRPAGAPRPRPDAPLAWRTRHHLRGVR